MKVIGKTEDGYLINAKQDELANLQGMYSHYDDNFRLNIGDEINIKPFYDMAKEAVRLRNRSDELRTAANHIDSAIRIIDFVTKSEG